MTLNLRVMPLECGDKIWCQKTRIMGLPYGEEIMIIGWTMWAQSTSVTDRQMDRQTDRFMMTNNNIIISQDSKVKVKCVSIQSTCDILPPSYACDSEIPCLRHPSILQVPPTNTRTHTIPTTTFHIRLPSCWLFKLQQLQQFQVSKS